MRQIFLIAHNLRSCHNVGSLLRTAEGLGVDRVFLTGYTPYPVSPKDARLPHLAAKQTRHIEKTALGATKTVAWEHTELDLLLPRLKSQNTVLAALEQSAASLPLTTFRCPGKIALLIGNETEGVELGLLSRMDHILEIPMLGKKESFNVTQAAAIALFYLRFAPFAQ